MLDSRAPFYEVYETSDSQFMAVGAIEAKFYAALLDGLGLAGEQLPGQFERDEWPAMKERFAAIFVQKTRDEWTELFADVDACVTPVLSSREAAHHRYNTSRTVFDTTGVVQPLPAPRFSKTPGAISRAPGKPGSGTRSGLGELGSGRSATRGAARRGCFWLDVDDGAGQGSGDPGTFRIAPTMNLPKSSTLSAEQRTITS